MNIEYFRAKYSQLGVDIQALIYNSCKSTHNEEVYYDTSCFDILDQTSDSEFSHLDDVSIVIDQSQAVSLDI